MRLRNFTIALIAAGIMLSGGLALTHCSAAGLLLAGYWSLALVAILVERGRYRPKLSGTRFTPTAERYADPVSGQRIRVYVDPASGERDYRPENGAAS